MKKGVMPQESELVPCHLSPPPGERIIVLAPHPDDETFGCGGTIRLLIGAGKKVKVLFLISGDRGDPAREVSPAYSESVSEACHVTGYSLMREREAGKALGVLGVSDYEFLRVPDRRVHAHYHDALQRISEAVGAFVPDTVYALSMVELNPDHRTAAALSMEIRRMSTQGVSGRENPLPMRIVFYEITTPLRPNILVDITPAYRMKKRAMERYKSQMRPIDYPRHITAVNTMRALTVNGPRYVEGFWCIERPLSSEKIAQWLSYGEVLAGGC